VKQHLKKVELYNLISGSSVEIKRYVKLNGIKTDVSFLSKLDAWIVCINNYSFVLKSKKDLELIKLQK
jgi:hypothetical protein